ncbi:unnamed protein product [Closterium sp. Yama58-4]|nr:unnamed protein product [Closterium sp. Yama58-4]
MATLNVLSFDPDGRQIEFATWLNACSSNSLTHSQWQTRDTAARLAIRNHLLLTERAHFGQHKTAKDLYAAIAACYSSPAIAALIRLILPYLFRELSSFYTIEDLISHLRTSDVRYRAALPDVFLAANPPPMYITLYFLVTCLPDSLRTVRDHFHALDPTALTVKDFDKHLLAAKKGIVAVDVARGTPCTPLFEGCSPSPLAPSYASAAAVDFLGQGRRGGAVVEATGVVEVAEVAVGVVAGVEASVAVVAAAVGVEAAEVEAVGAVVVEAAVAAVATVGAVAAAVVAVGVEPFRGGALVVASGSSSSNNVRARPLRPSSFTCGKFHTEYHCFSRLDDA